MKKYYRFAVWVCSRHIHVGHLNIFVFYAQVHVVNRIGVWLLSANKVRQQA